jgi:predicted N-acyltransferase
MTRTAKIVAAAGVVACVTLVLTCVLFQGEKREVKNLVLAYNNMLLRAHAELTSSVMQNLTSEREFRKIDNYLAYLYKNKRTIESTILRIEFEDVKIEDNRASVVTKERWKYFYVDPVNRKPVSEVYDVLYGNTYTLKKAGGHWVVDDLISTEIGGTTEG